MTYTAVLPKTRAPAIERLFRSFDRDPDSGCWTWRGRLSNNGYAVIGVEGRTHKAHRFAYETMVEPIPEGLDIDHLCRNRACVNPAHLEPVTRRENLLRSPITVASINAAKNTCPQGHEYDYVVPTTGRRQCRTCSRDAVRRFLARTPEAAA